MDSIQLSNYIDKYCRFKMRSGKEVYGVIWRNSEGNKVMHYFASVVARMKYKKAEQLRDNKACEELKVPVDIEEIVDAEPLGQSL